MVKQRYVVEERSEQPMRSHSTRTSIVTTTTTEKDGSTCSNSVIWVILTIVWLVLLVLGFIFIVVGIALPKWVQGTLSGVTTEIGLFEQCVDDDCFSSSINIDTWKAAAAFFILALILIFVDVVLVIVSFFYCRVIPAAKIVLSIANLFLMIAIILVPIGFAFLDDSCPGTDEMQCGIACGDANDDFSYFTLCGPYEVGDSLWVLIVGIILIFISSFFAACIRLQTTIVEEQVLQ